MTTSGTAFDLSNPPVITPQSATYTTNNLNQYTEISQQSAGGSQQLSYDLDGNLTNDGIHQFTYDAENRLTSVTPITPTAGSKNVEYAYDYMSRRVQKQVSTYDGSSWVLETAKSFVYDGWNLIKEQTTGGTSSTNFYVWGLDVSGSLQGAGGIGGLLMRKSDTGTFLYLYDVNGNVEQLLNSRTGEIAARYKYSPFGMLLVADGPEAEKNPYRFSTKYFIPEIGWYDYGRRYYSPKLGRWPTRDPIEEEGGLNLYGFVENDPINLVDAFGELILSMEVKGSGESWIEGVNTSQLGPGVWWRFFETPYYREVGKGKKLGLHTGKGYDPSESFWAWHFGWGKGQPVAFGLLKFEAKAVWSQSGEESRPYWTHYASNIQVRKIDTETGETEILHHYPKEFRDGTIKQATSVLEAYKNSNGTFNTYAWDAPRIAPEFCKNKRYRYVFEGEWRLQVQDDESVWETKFRLGFSYDDDLDLGTIESYFEIISPPMQIEPTQ